MSDQEFTPRVFISYAWEGETQAQIDEFKARILAFSDRLRSDGIDVRIDQYDPHQPDPWPRWMNDQIELAHKVLMVFTPTYRDRFDGKATPGGNGVAHEGLVIQQYLYDSKGKNQKFRAILLDGYDQDALSMAVRPYTSYCPDDAGGYEDLVRWLYDSPRATPAPLGKRPDFLSSVTAIPGIARVEDVRALPERYFRTRDLLIRQCQKIPIFGQVMEDVPMDRNFVRLRLSLSSGDVDEERKSHDSRPDYLESEDLRIRDKKRHWGDDEPEQMRRKRPIRISIEVPELWKNYAKTAILGLPGAGKTTILRHFVYLATRLEKMPVVVFVACRSLRGIHFSGVAEPDADGFLTAAAAFLYPSFGDPLAEEDDKFHPTAEEQEAIRIWSKDQLKDIRDLAAGMRIAAKKQQLVVLVDAFDETPENIRNETSAWLVKLVEAVPASTPVPEGATGNRCYLSARRHELEVFRSLHAPVFEVEPLNQDQMRDFAKALYGEKSGTYASFDAIVWREPVMQKMGRTPLTALLLLCYFDVHQRFDTRFHTYDLLVKFVLLNVWESIKRRRFTRDAGRMRQWFVECADPDFEEKNEVVMMRYRALAKICHLLLYDSADHPDSGTREASERDILTAFEQAQPGGLDAKERRRRAYEWLKDFRKAHLLIATGPTTYVFVHSTLMEYLAAWHLCHLSEAEMESAMKRMCSSDVLDSGSLDTLPIACGNSPESNLRLFPLMERFLEPTYFPEVTDFLAPGIEMRQQTVCKSLQTLFRCVAEAESMEYGIIMSYTVLSYRNEVVQSLEPCVEARQAAYQHLKTLVQLANEETVKVWMAWLTGKPKEEILSICEREDFASIPDRDYLELALSRSDAFPRRYLPDWWEGRGSMTADQHALLMLMVKYELKQQVHLLLESARLENRQTVPEKTAPSGTISKSVRRLDKPGDPEDTNFSANLAVVGGELAGMLGSPNFRHGAGINAMAVHPVETHLVFTGGGDGVIRLWDTQSGREIRSFAGHSNRVTCCALDATGTRLVSGSHDNTLKLWDTQSGREIRSFAGHSGTVWCCALDATGTRLVSGSDDNTLKLWDTQSGREIRSFAGHSGTVWCCALDATGTRLVSGSDDKTLKLWDTQSGREIRSFAGHSGTVWCCALDATGTRLVSGSNDNTLKLWDTQSGREIRSFAGHSGFVMCCALDATGTRLVSGSYDKTLKLWDTQSGREIRSFVGHSGAVMCCALDATGTRLVSGSHDNTLKLWDTQSGREIRSFAGHSGFVICCALDATGTRLVSGSYDKTLKLWDTQSGREIRSFAGHSGFVMCCALDATGTRLVSGSHDNTLKLWDTQSGREIRSFAGHSGTVWCCALDATGTRLVSGSGDKTLKLWDTQSGREIRSFPGHSGFVMCCALDATGTRLVSGSNDNTLKLWDTQSGREIRSFAGHSGTVWCCALDATGTRLVSGADDQTLKLWDTQSGRKIRSFAGHSGTVRCCALDATGTRLVSGSDDNTLKLWDTQSGREIRSWNLPFGPLALSLTLAAGNLWPERTHGHATLVLSIGLSNGVILLLDLTEYL